MDIFIQLKKDRKHWINFKIFKAEVENQLDKRIKIARSNRGGSTTVGPPHFAKFLDLLQSSYRKMA
jgi:extradiol dioxygenase family protein